MVCYRHGDVKISNLELADYILQLHSHNDCITELNRLIQPLQYKQCQKKTPFEDFPGGPVVKTLPFSEGDIGSFLVRELRSHMPCRQKKKKKN